MFLIWGSAFLCASAEHTVAPPPNPFVVCQAVGLETGSPASDYIQLWNGDAQMLTESLGDIRQAASQILGALTDA